MGKWGKFIIAAAAPLVLTACLWSPGKFASELTLRKNGTYTLDYKGEILFQLPDGGMASKRRAWSDSMAFCFEGGSKIREFEPPIPDDPDVSDVTIGGKKVRECTAIERAKLKAEFDKKEADLVLVDGDVSTDLGALRRVVTVVSDGYVMDGDALRKAAGYSGRPK